LAAIRDAVKPGGPGLSLVLVPPNLESSTTTTSSLTPQGGLISGISGISGGPVQLVLPSGCAVAGAVLRIGVVGGALLAAPDTGGASVVLGLEASTVIAAALEGAVASGAACSAGVGFSTAIAALKKYAAERTDRAFPSDAAVDNALKGLTAAKVIDDDLAKAITQAKAANAETTIGNRQVGMECAPKDPKSPESLPPLYTRIALGTPSWAKELLNGRGYARHCDPCDSADGSGAFGKKCMGVEPQEKRVVPCRCARMPKEFGYDGYIQAHDTRWDCSSTQSDTSLLHYRNYFDENACSGLRQIFDKIEEALKGIGR
jgi:hypothetical protein